MENVISMFQSKTPKINVKFSLKQFGLKTIDTINSAIEVIAEDIRNLPVSDEDREVITNEFNQLVVEIQQEINNKPYSPYAAYLVNEKLIGFNNALDAFVESFE